MSTHHRGLTTIMLAALLIAYATASHAADLAIIGANILDANQASARENRAILIEDDRIIRVGPTDEVDMPDGATVIDARGKWVIPD